MAMMIVSYLLVAFFCLAAGTFCGLILGRRLRSELPAGTGEPQSVAREVLRRVQGVTERIAHDVSTHRSAVREVDDQLHAVDVERDGVETVVELVSELVERNDVIQRKLADAESKLDQLTEQITAQHVESRTDSASGCPNRVAFDEELAQRHEAFMQHQEPFCVVLLEIDRLAEVDERNGAGAADDAVRHVGRTLRRLARASDLVARFGPHEFALIMPHMTMTQAKHAADAIRQAIATHPLVTAVGDLRLTASVGVVDAMPYEECHQLVQRAGATLYAAKKGGGDRVCWHDGTAIHSIEPGPDFGGDRTEPRRPHTTHDTVPLDDGNAAVVELGTCAAGESETPFDRELVQNLPSKTSFCQEVRRRLAESQRGGAAVSVFLARLDNMEELTRQYGMRAAELALATLANLVRGLVREMDTLARYEPESFGLLMPGATQQHVRGVCERLRRAADETSITLHGATIRLDVSLAGTEAREGEEMAALLGRLEHDLEESGRAAAAPPGCSN